MLVLYFVTDQGLEREVGHFVMRAVLGLRIVVPEALRRPFWPTVAAAAIRFFPDVAASLWPAVVGSGNPVTLRRHSVSAVAAQTNSYRRSRLWEARLWVSSLVGERNWPSWCLLGPVGFSSIVTSALRVARGAMVDDDCIEGCSVQIMLASVRQERLLFRTDRDRWGKWEKCTLRHLVRSPQVEVEQSPLNSILEPAQCSDRTLLADWFFQAFAELHSCLNFAVDDTVSLRVEGLTMTVTAVTSSWLVAFLWLRTSSRGATLPQLLSRQPRLQQPSLNFQKGHTTTGLVLTLLSTHMATGIFAYICFMWNLR